MPKPFVSVIIPTYNRSELLSMTLDSFVSQRYPPGRYEIIVANNNSTDDTAAILNSYCSRFPFVRAIMETRQGVHYARNSAAKIANGDILYFTDDDMIAEQDLLEEIVKVFDMDPMIGSATGMIIGKFVVPPPSWVTKYLTNSYLSLTEADKPEDLIISRNDLVYSCHEAVRRDVFFRCGGFNPENTAGVWLGDGETGLGIKIKKAGLKFAYTSKAVIYHVIPQSRTTLSYLVRRLGNQGSCDAYTEYRMHRTRRGIVSGLLKRNTAGLVKNILYTVAKILSRRESWHFIPARMAYLYSRNRYDIRLLTDPSFKQMAEIDDWLEEER